MKQYSAAQGLHIGDIQVDSAAQGLYSAPYFPDSTKDKKHEKQQTSVPGVPSCAFCQGCAFCQAHPWVSVPGPLPLFGPGLKGSKYKKELIYTSTDVWAEIYYIKLKAFFKFSILCG